MEIYILSCGRAFRQPTWNSLPEELREHTRLVVPKGEQNQYKKFPLLVEPNLPHTGHVRQFIMEEAKGNFVMLDDDLTFSVRREDQPDKFRNAMPEEITAAFKEMFALLKVRAHASIAMREGANRDTSKYKENTRQCRVLAYNRKILYRIRVQFDRAYGMDDFDATLQLLRRGYSNIVLNWIVQNQYGSNAAGGASTWRTLDIQEKAALRLKELHPDFVTVVRKQTKTAWQGKERTDVIVQWKKAYESL